MPGQESSGAVREEVEQKSEPFSFRIPSTAKPPPKPEPIVFGWENENVHQNTQVGQTPKWPVLPHRTPVYSISAKGRWAIKSGGRNKWFGEQQETEEKKKKIRRRRKRRRPRTDCLFCRTPSVSPLKENTQRIHSLQEYRIKFLHWSNRVGWAASEKVTKFYDKIPVWVKNGGRSADGIHTNPIPRTWPLDDFDAMFTAVKTQMHVLYCRFRFT